MHKSMQVVHTRPTQRDLVCSVYIVTEKVKEALAEWLKQLAYSAIYRDVVSHT